MSNVEFSLNEGSVIRTNAVRIILFALLERYQAEYINHICWSFATVV